MIARAVRATLVTFFFAGFTVASVLSRIPTIRDTLELSPTEMGHILFVGALGSAAWLVLSGPVVAKIGVKRSVLICVAIWALGLTLVIVSYAARSPWGLAVSLFVAQSGAGLWNSTMNIESGYVEVLGRKVRLPWYHAAFSFGTVSAALLGALMIALTIPVVVHFILVLVITVPLMIYATAGFIPDTVIGEIAASTEGATARTRRAWRERLTILISLIPFATGLLEGAANDWLALAMIDGFHAPAYWATATLAFFLIVVTATRIVAPRLRQRVENSALLRRCLICAIIGVSFFAFAPWWPLALIGVAGWGIGAALGFPAAAAALSRDPAMTAARLSVLSTIGYTAFLAGPPTLGYIAEHVGYRSALAVIVIPVVVATILTPTVREGRDIH